MIDDGFHQTSLRPGRRWTFAHCEYVEVSRQLLVHGIAVKIEGKPLNVLQHLLENPARVHTKDELLGASWDIATTDQSLATAISKLRSAFGVPREEIILTVSGVGYRLAVPVVCKFDVQPGPPTLKINRKDPIPGKEKWIAERALGSAGNPTVWVAEHLKTHEAHVFKFAVDGVRLRALQREVAISRVFQQALEREERFLRIIDWNFEQSPYFIESEYCGLNLFEFSETEDFRKMPADDRVAIVAQIAGAISAAHNLGIIHNDLKPGNILLLRRYAEAERPSELGVAAKDWQIKIVDFGVASLDDPASRLQELEITDHGQFDPANPADRPVGTAMYRAPELRLQGATPNTLGDVYALGVILYQMVCGDFLSVPSVGWETRIADAVLRDDIAAAANIDAERRLSSASELAKRLRALDVRRAEMEQRTEAEFRAERASRQMERIRLRRPWLIVAMMTLILGLSASLWSALAAGRARKAAEFDAAYARRLEKFIAGLFTGGDDGVPSKDMTAGELLERGVRQARALDDDPSEQADFLGTLGEVYDARGDFDTADHLLHDAMIERQRISGSNHPEFARILVAISSLRDEQGRADEALTFAQRAYDIDVHALPPDAPQTLEAQLAIGSALTNLGQYNKAAPLLEAVIQKDRGKPDRLKDLSEAIDDLSIAALYLGNVQQALSLDMEGLSLDRQRLGDKNPDIGADLINISQAEAQLGDYAKAESYGREALAVYQNWYPPGHFEIAGAETTLSDALIDEGRTTEALPLLGDALRIQRALFPGANEKTAHTLAALGRAEYALHHPNDALTYYKEAAAQYLSLIPDKDYRLASMLYNEARVYHDQGDLARAENTLREALSIDTTRLPASDKRLLDIRLLLGEVLLQEHQPIAAQPLLAQTYRDASTAGADCRQELDRAAKDLQFLADAQAMTAHHP